MTIIFKNLPYMKTKHFLFVILTLLMSLSACSSDDSDSIFNHDLDNTVWLREKTTIDDQIDYLEGIIFSDGYFQSVALDKKTGGVLRVNFSYKYLHDKLGERILLFNDKPDKSKGKGISMKKGVIFFNGYKYYQKVI